MNRPNQQQLQQQQKEAQLTCEQELQLFMRWLNMQFDAMSKIQQPQLPSRCTAGCSASHRRHNFVVCHLLYPSDAPSSPMPKKAQFAPTDEQRRDMMLEAHRLLRSALGKPAPPNTMDCVRYCEFELLMRAKTLQEYLDPSTLVARLVKTVSRHPEWGLPRLEATPDGSALKLTPEVMDLTEDDAEASNAPGPAATGRGTAQLSSPSQQDSVRWRTQITEEIRQDMIYRVEKMLRLVSHNLNINTQEELHLKVQQYEMGLVISSSSLEEYVDRTTLPRRLASLVTDFAEYKKSLTPQQLMGLQQQTNRSNGTDGK
jgi:hypothetical protein